MITSLFRGTNFDSDILRGKVGETIFTEDFLDFLNIQYENVTASQGYRIIDSDFLAKIGLYEIKTSYKDNREIIIEEFTNCNNELGKISPGWYTNPVLICLFL